MIYTRSQLYELSKLASFSKSSSVDVRFQNDKGVAQVFIVKPEIGVSPGPYGITKDGDYEGWEEKKDA